MFHLAGCCHHAGMSKDARLGVTILVFLVVFIGLATVHVDVLVRLVLGGLCAGLAWLLTRRGGVGPRS